MDKVNNFRKWSLAIAEAIDAYRLIPRLMIGSYGALIGYITYVFLTFDVVNKVTCDAGVMKVLMDSKVPLAEAQKIACNVVDILGPPTSYTILLSTLVGAAALIFGLYTNSGRSWSVPFMAWGLDKKVDPTVPQKSDVVK